jgi:exonuclease VII large subunit
MFDYMSPRIFDTLSTTILALAKIKYNSFYNRMVQNLKGTRKELNENQRRSIYSVPERIPNKIKESLHGLSDNKIKLKKKNLMFRSNKLDKEFSPSLKVNNQYNNSRKDLMDTMNQILDKMHGRLNHNQEEMIFFIYKTAMEHSFTNITRRIQENYADIISRLKGAWRP